MRLFADVPWLGPQLLAAVRDYARDISIDTDAIESALQLDRPDRPRGHAAALQDRLFAPEPSPGAAGRPGRLETLLALVEGWVDVVADRATARPPAARPTRSGEAVRRRRATGGPAEKAFGALVGLELRPRRLRDAANLWAALEESGGGAPPATAPGRTPTSRRPRPTSTTRWATSSGPRSPQAATRWTPRSTRPAARRGRRRTVP